MNVKSEELKVGDKILTSTDRTDERTGLPIMRMVEIKCIHYVFEVCSIETPNHTYNIGEGCIKGMLQAEGN